MEKYSEPFNIKELQAFLGLINFYRKFLPAITFTLRLSLTPQRPQELNRHRALDPEDENGLLSCEAGPQ
jgi:hypothetical protein